MSQGGECPSPASGPRLQGLRFLPQSPGRSTRWQAWPSCDSLSGSVSSVQGCGASLELQGFSLACGIHSSAPQRKLGGLKQPKSACSLPQLSPRVMVGKAGLVHCDGALCVCGCLPPLPVSRLATQRSALLLWAVNDGVCFPAGGFTGSIKCICVAQLLPSSSIPVPVHPPDKG